MFSFSAREASTRTDHSHLFLQDQPHQQDLGLHRPIRIRQNTMPLKASALLATTTPTTMPMYLVTFTKNNTSNTR